MEKNKKRAIAFITGCTFLLILGMLLAVGLGAAHISISGIWRGIFHNSEELEIILIREVRIPRALCALFTGGILGVTGAMIQGVTRNPIAEPSLLGVSQGATLAIAAFYAGGIAISTGSVMGAALIGAVFSGTLVIGFVSQRANNSSVTKILLGGTAMSTFFLSLTTIIGLLSNKAQLIGFWVGGGFRNASWSDFRLVLAAGTAGLVLAVMLSGKINVLSLGDDVAVGLGQNPERIRLKTLLVMIPMCAAAVAVGKNIGFVGLIVPQIIRKVLGEDYRKIIPVSFLVGAVILTYADIAARMAFAPYEMPVGMFTALIGVPFFIAAARKERG